MGVMKIYAVGGSVRDAILGLPVQDRDFVVVGASPEDMVAKGFMPVGKDFPVFLHPETHEEYALARTERKTAPGYSGFVFHTSSDVTLEEDLARRDLTINAIAQAEDGSLIDPYGGQRDLTDRVFRHVSHAFAEDPVRILRLARFAARFVDFTVAPDTMDLMRSMVANGEVDALVAERVWQEVARGLMEAQPSRMFAVLHACGALQRVFPELDVLWRSDEAPTVMATLDLAAHAGHTLTVRFALLAHAWTAPTVEQGTEQIEIVCERLRVPSDCKDLARLAAREADLIPHAPSMSASEIVNLLVRSDAFRKPERFRELLLVAECVAGASWHVSSLDSPPARLLRALHAAQAIDSGAIAKTCAGDVKKIPVAIFDARVEAVASVLQA